MAFARIPDMKFNLATEGDSYKWSHWNQYPAETTRMMSYFESRGGPFAECTLFGLQYVLNKYIARPLTQDAVDEAKAFAAAHGEPFNDEGWRYIVEQYDGKLPVRIRAIGADTMQRMLDPEWGPDVVDMLREMSNLGTRFWVMERVVDGRVLTCRDIEVSWPHQNLFEPLEGRLDVSSTELRAQGVG